MGRTSSARQRLLKAASDLLWEKSYHSVTVDEVCARASVRKGSLYHFFDSKSALTVAVLQHLWKTVAEPAYEKHFSSANAPLARITDFVGWLQRLELEKFDEVGRVLGWPFFTLGCELGAREPAICKELCDIGSAELSYFESAILDAVDRDAIEPGIAREEALSLRASIEGILARARILNDPDELSALIALPTRVLCHLRWCRQRDCLGQSARKGQVMHRSSFPAKHFLGIKNDPKLPDLNRITGGLDDGTPI